MIISLTDRFGCSRTFGLNLDRTSPAGQDVLEVLQSAVLKVELVFGFGVVRSGSDLFPL